MLQGFSKPTLLQTNSMYNLVCHPLLQAAAALRRLDSAGSFDSSTSGAAGAACTGRGSGSPVIDPKDVQAVAAAMLLLREGEAPGPDPSTARTEVWGPHAGPAVAQTGSDLSSIYSQVGALPVGAVFRDACLRCTATCLRLAQLPVRWDGSSSAAREQRHAHDSAQLPTCHWHA